MAKKNKVSVVDDAPLTPEEEATVQRRIRIGYAMIALPLGLALLICFWPQLIGVRGQAHPLIAGGLLMMALYRGARMFSRIRQQQQQLPR